MGQILPLRWAPAGNYTSFIPHDPVCCARHFPSFFCPGHKNIQLLKKITAYSPAALTSQLAATLQKEGVLGQGGNNIDAPFNPSQIAELQFFVS